jgi:hypothetical protein
MREAASRSASPSVALIYFAAAAANGDAQDMALAARRLEEVGFAKEDSAVSLANAQCWSEESRKAIGANLTKGFRLLTGH